MFYLKQNVKWNDCDKNILHLKCESWEQREIERDREDLLYQVLADVQQSDVWLKLCQVYGYQQGQTVIPCGY